MRAKNPLLMIAFVVTIAAILYPLSYPPAVLSARKSLVAMKFVMTAYRPVLLLAHSNPTLLRLFTNYCDLWGAPVYLNSYTVELFNRKE